MLDEDFLVIAPDSLPISPEFVSRGFPFRIAGWSSNETHSIAQISELVQKLGEMPHADDASWLAMLILQLWDFPRGRVSLPSAAHVKLLYQIASGRFEKPLRPYWLDSFISSFPDGVLSADWIDFLDWLGRELAIAAVESPRQDVADQLINHFGANPDGRRGLLPIIAALAEAGCQCHVSQYALDIAKAVDSRWKDDAAGLILSKPALTDAEVITAVKDLLQSQSVPRAIWRALKIATANSLERAAKVALAILSEHQDFTQADAAEQARRTLGEFLTVKPSLLQHSETWRKLNLPERL